MRPLVTLTMQAPPGSFAPGMAWVSELEDIGDRDLRISGRRRERAYIVSQRLAEEVYFTLRSGDPDRAERLADRLAERARSFPEGESRTR